MREEIRLTNHYRIYGIYLLLSNLIYLNSLLKRVEFYHTLWVNQAQNKLFLNRAQKVPSYITFIELGYKLKLGRLVIKKRALLYTSHWTDLPRTMDLPTLWSAGQLNLYWREFPNYKITWAWKIVYWSFLSINLYFKH